MSCGKGSYPYLARVGRVFKLTLCGLLVEKGPTHCLGSKRACYNEAVKQMELSASSTAVHSFE